MIIDLHICMGVPTIYTQVSNAKGQATCPASASSKKYRILEKSTLPNVILHKSEMSIPDPELDLNLKQVAI